MMFVSFWLMICGVILTITYTKISNLLEKIVTWPVILSNNYVNKTCNSLFNCFLELFCSFKLTELNLFAIFRKLQNVWRRIWKMILHPVLSNLRSDTESSASSSVTRSWFSWSDRRLRTRTTAASSWAGCSCVCVPPPSRPVKTYTRYTVVYFTLVFYDFTLIKFYKDFN